MSGQTNPDTSNDLDSLVSRWLRQDKDEDTRSTIQGLVDHNNEKELKALLGSRKLTVSHP